MARLCSGGRSPSNRGPPAPGPADRPGRRVRVRHVHRTSAGEPQRSLLFRPAFDIRGRDLLVQLVNSPYASFVQIKGTAMLLGTDRIRFHLRRNTFVPADDFWCAFYFWDNRRAAFFPECWLIPSRELARRTAHQRDASYLTVDARLDASLDQWADCRHPIEDQADVLRGALHGLRAAA